MVLAMLLGRLRRCEVLGSCLGDLSPGAHVCCPGKGCKHRAVPITKPTRAMLKVWIAEHGTQRDQPLFPTRAGRRLSTDAVARLVREHAKTAADKCPSIQPGRLHPHVLRHTCTMRLLHAGVDTAVTALWLGHADLPSTNVYLHADMAIK